MDERLSLSVGPACKILPENYQNLLVCLKTGETQKLQLTCETTINLWIFWVPFFRQNHIMMRKWKRSSFQNKTPVFLWIRQLGIRTLNPALNDCFPGFWNWLFVGPHWFHLRFLSVHGYSHTHTQVKCIPLLISFLRMFPDYMFSNSPFQKNWKFMEIGIPSKGGMEIEKWLESPTSVTQRITRLYVNLVYRGIDMCVV